MTRSQRLLFLVENKSHDVFYVPIGNSIKVEVIKNPTDQEFQSMIKEVKKQFPNMMPGEVKIRSTYDEDHNKYIWKAHEAPHVYIEDYLKEKGISANQNNEDNSTHVLHGAELNDLPEFPVDKDDKSNAWKYGSGDFPRRTVHVGTIKAKR